MGQIDQLLRNYSRFVELPWVGNLDGKQRVWFAVYPPPRGTPVARATPRF